MNELVLILASILLTYAFAELPRNKMWVEGRIIPYIKMIPTEWEMRDVETRKRYRYGYEYNIKTFLEQHLDSTSVFLIPPQTYMVSKMFTNRNQETHLWVYPSLLYYHNLYLKTADMGSTEEELAKATHTFLVGPDGNLSLLELNDANRKQVTDEFSQYELKTFFHAYQVSDWLKENAQ